MDESLYELLAAVAAGDLGVPEAAAELERHGLAAVGDFGRLDLGRRARTGVPEIVFARGKSMEQLTAITVAFLRQAASVFCSRVGAPEAAAIEAAVKGAAAEAAVVQKPPGDSGAAHVDLLDGAQVVYDPRSQVLIARRRDFVAPPPAGVVGIIAAGSSDVPVAEEAAAICREMAVEVHTAYDVGVAGAHRIGAPLRRILDAGAAALVVAAGMEGALPSLVAGMVDVPVIGLPTSIGYGFGGGGEAALLGMLQSCAPGLVVVNIDNGVGAGATAALIARRVKP
jgi:NCAIR mutase (PurE)-related protein